jgi:hypothetical protein
VANSGEFDPSVDLLRVETQFLCLVDGTYSEHAHQVVSRSTDSRIEGLERICVKMKIVQASGTSQEKIPRIFEHPSASTVDNVPDSVTRGFDDR